jgi:hypothetical protein
LELDTSHLVHKLSFRPVRGVATPFGNDVRRTAQSGLSIAARWFLDRGYLVSVPLEPAPYDLITESDDGLMRVQVKTTRSQERSGRYRVHISHMIHDGSVPRNANGSRKPVPYTADQVDYFFIATPVSMYLIPITVVPGVFMIVLDKKYAAFAVLVLVAQGIERRLPKARVAGSNPAEDAMGLRVTAGRSARTGLLACRSPINLYWSGQVSAATMAHRLINLVTARRVAR